jgi:hypothetical protein
MIEASDKHTANATGQDAIDSRPSWLRSEGGNGTGPDPNRAIEPLLSSRPSTKPIESHLSSGTKPIESRLLSGPPTKAIESHLSSGTSTTAIDSQLSPAASKTPSASTTKSSVVAEALVQCLGATSTHHRKRMAASSGHADHAMKIADCIVADAMARAKKARLADPDASHSTDCPSLLAGFKEAYAAHTRCERMGINPCSSGHYGYGNRVATSVATGVATGRGTWGGPFLSGLAIPTYKSALS